MYASDPNIIIIRIRTHHYIYLDKKETGTHRQKDTSQVSKERGKSDAYFLTIIKTDIRLNFRLLSDQNFCLLSCFAVARMMTTETEKCHVLDCHLYLIRRLCVVVNLRTIV